MSDIIYVKSKASLDVAHDAQYLVLDHHREDEIISEEMTYQESGTVKIDGAATVTVDLGSITTIKGLLIDTEDRVNVYLDAQVDPIKLRPGTKTEKSRILVDGLSATVLKLENPISGGDSSARVTYQIVGD